MKKKLEQVWSVFMGLWLLFIGIAAAFVAVRMLAERDCFARGVILGIAIFMVGALVGVPVGLAILHEAAKGE